jgi:putative membrane protein
VSGPPMLGHATSLRGWSWGDWGHDPFLVVGLAVVIVLCAMGIRGRRGVRGLKRGAALAGGLVVLALALVSPVHSASATLLSAHMVQHLLLVVVAAPLLALGRPGRAMLRSLPRSLRRWAVAPRLARAVHRICLGMARPVPAWIVFTIALWAWHLPAAYGAAVRSEPIHAVEHLCFLGTAMVAWSVVLRDRPGEGLGALGRALWLLATAAQGGLLGALLLFARTPLYPVHGNGPASWGLTPLQDQQLAGAIMWIPPGAIYLVVSAAILLRWFRSMDERLRPRGTVAGWERR